MNTFSIAVIPGDGIGKELAPEGVRVLDAAASACGTFRLAYEYFPWGCEYYIEHRTMMPENGLDILKCFDAIYFGAVGFPKLVPDDVSLHGLLLKIRLGFDQYICLRPSVLLPGVASPLAGVAPGDIDFVVVRENTEGEYAGAGGRVHRGQPIELALETSVFTRIGVERVIRYAFELARSRPRKLLASVTKSNAQKHTLTFWDEVFEEIAKDYPDVKTERVLVDAMAARFVLHPRSLDVIVASNLFADILTDIGGAITGSLGLAASTNINPERRYPSMFEPVHGSAPDIAGKGIANPIGQVWAGSMMLEHLGQPAAAASVMRAIRRVVAEGPVTPDLGGKASTRDMGLALVQALD
jgi:tartrate dehydrogenase/decarboxylase/D-malate dehydrogenase